MISLSDFYYNEEEGYQLFALTKCSCESLCCVCQGSFSRCCFKNIFPVTLIFLLKTTDIAFICTCFTFNTVWSHHFSQKTTKKAKLNNRHHRGGN